MAGFSIKTLAEDLLSLEINTIVKADMTGSKMPANRREALLKIYKTYHVKLEELQCREPIIWSSAGLMGFLELRERARLGTHYIDDELHNSDELDTLSIQILNEKLVMLRRIKGQCEQIVTMFIQLGEQHFTPKKAKSPKPSKPSTAHIIPDAYFDLEQYRETMAERVESAEVEEFSAYDEASYPWNNDLPRNKMHRVPDLELNAAQISLLRKISEIGTERIMLQTVIQADGDVTTRIAERLIYAPNETLFKLHNQAVDNSVNFWGQLVNTIGNMAKSLFGNGSLKP